jgi:ribosomal protein L11 methylase PrmA
MKTTDWACLFKPHSSHRVPNFVLFGRAAYADKPSSQAAAVAFRHKCECQRCQRGETTHDQGHDHSLMLEYTVAGSKLVLSNGCTKAARLTARFLEEQRISAGKVFLELGAGTGLVGMAAAFLGASAVMLTDQEPMMETLQENCAFNVTGALQGNVFLASLFWGDALTQKVSDFANRVDIILAVDLVRL